MTSTALESEHPSTPHLLCGTMQLVCVQSCAYLLASIPAKPALSVSTKTGSSIKQVVTVHPARTSLQANGKVQRDIDNVAASFWFIQHTMTPLTNDRGHRQARKCGFYSSNPCNYSTYCSSYPTCTKLRTTRSRTHGAAQREEATNIHLHMFMYTICIQYHHYCYL